MKDFGAGLFVGIACVTLWYVLVRITVKAIHDEIKSLIKKSKENENKFQGQN